MGESDSLHLNLSGQDAAVFLGPTEAKLMELAWINDRLTIKKALSLLDERPGPAYTTVMTVMNRLCEKDLLIRARDGRHFVYEAAVSREDFLSSRVKSIIACLKSNFPDQFQEAVK